MKASQVAGGSISRGDRLRLAPALVGKTWAAVIRNPYLHGAQPSRPLRVSALLHPLSDRRRHVVTSIRNRYM